MASGEWAAVVVCRLADGEGSWTSNLLTARAML